MVIGVGSVDPDHYRGKTMADSTCENDARDMAAFAKERGFQLLGTITDGEPKEAPIITRAATRAAIRATVRFAAATLTPQDIFLVCFSGHGSSLPVRDSVLVKDASADERSQLWCLWDGRLWEEQWKDMLSAFQEGVRVVVVNDSCYGGGFGPPRQIDREVQELNPCPDPRTISEELTNTIWDELSSEFESVRAGPPIEPLKAQVLLLAACQANQVACPGKRNGLFTRRLLDVATAHPRLTYQKLFSYVQRKFPSTQSPFYWSAGSGSDKFGHQEAFSIAAAPTPRLR